MSRPAHEKRWRALAASTQWSVVFDLASAIKIREAKIANMKGRGEGGQVNKTRLRTAIAADRALLMLLQSVTPESVFADALEKGNRP